MTVPETHFLLTMKEALLLSKKYFFPSILLCVLHIATLVALISTVYFFYVIQENTWLAIVGGLGLYFIFSIITLVQGAYFLHLCKGTPVSIGHAISQVIRSWSLHYWKTLGIQLFITVIGLYLSFISSAVVGGGIFLGIALILHYFFGVPGEIVWIAFAGFILAYPVVGIAIMIITLSQAFIPFILTSTSHLHAHPIDNSQHFAIRHWKELLLLCLSIFGILGITFFLGKELPMNTLIGILFLLLVCISIIYKFFVASIFHKEELYALSQDTHP